MLRLAPIHSFSRRRLSLGAVLTLLLVAGCSAKVEPNSGGSNTPQARENRKVAENSAVESIQFAAKEQMAVSGSKKKGAFVSVVMPSIPEVPRSPQPNYPPEPLARQMAREASPVVISERIVTEIPYPTEAEADTRALEDAQKLIEKKLKELDPPVDYVPPVGVVKNEYVKRDSRLVRMPTDEEKAAISQAGYSADRKYVEYTVEITAEQIRELRTRNRVGDGFRVMLAVAAVSLAGFLFLRLDEWSKGYLTSWLAVAAAALAGGVVAAALFV